MIKLNTWFALKNLIKKWKNSFNNQKSIHNFHLYKQENAIKNKKNLEIWISAVKML